MTPLSDDKVRELQARLYPPKPKHDPTRRERNPEGVKATESWMSPLNRIIWHKAFKQKTSKVKIRDGREFVCKYFTKVAKSGDKVEMVKVDPAPGSANSFVPCGEFRYNDVTHISWVSDK